jgi:hypothetical protein
MAGVVPGSLWWRLTTDNPGAGRGGKRGVDLMHQDLVSRSYTGHAPGNASGKTILRTLVCRNTGVPVT